VLRVDIVNLKIVDARASGGCAGHLFEKKSEAGIILHRHNAEFCRAASRHFEFNLQAQMLCIPIARSAPVFDGKRHMIEFDHGTATSNYCGHAGP